MCIRSRDGITTYSGTGRVTILESSGPSRVYVLMVGVVEEDSSSLAVAVVADSVRVTGFV